MSKSSIHIIIAEPSQLICEGIISFLQKREQSVNTHIIRNLHEFDSTYIKSKAEIVILCPGLIVNQIREFQALKNSYPDVSWIAIHYSYFDKQILAEFNEIISINDSSEKINSVIDNILQSKLSSTQNPPQESLSDREIDVLKLLVEGNSNKEIADRLNISAHTVISHRKNITQKTGIKSVAGLTIYAVVNHIVILEN